MTGDRIDRLERQVRGLERDLNLLVKATANAPEAQPGETPATTDIVWSCVKCGSRLGLYDQANDELRVRYKDFVAYVRVGHGGVVRVVCRSCGELNALEYVDEHGGA